MTSRSPIHASRRGFASFAVAAAIMASAGRAAHAQSVDDLLKRKKIIIGVIQDFPPFGFLDGDQKLQGYDIDICNLIGKYLGVEVELQPVSAANRIPYLVTKRIDLLVASLGITPERAKQVLFTNPYAATQSVVLAPAATPISTLADLKGRRVAVARGSSNDIFIAKMAPEGTNLQRYDGEGASTQAMTAGQVDAIVMTNTMVPSMIQSAPAAKLEVKFAIQQQENAMAVRRDAQDFANWLNAFVYYVRRNGELDAIHRKWLGGALPTLGTL